MHVSRIIPFESILVADTTAELSFFNVSVRECEVSWWNKFFFLLEGRTGTEEIVSILLPSIVETENLDQVDSCSLIASAVVYNAEFDKSSMHCFLQLLELWLISHCDITYNLLKAILTPNN